MIVRKTVHCIFAGTRFCCSKNAKYCKFFLNRQPPVRYEVYDRVCKENPLQRVHSCGRRLAGISETPEHSGRKGEEYGKVYTFENGKKMRVVPSLERCNGQYNDPDENEDYFQVEMTEKQTCYQTARTTQALNSCSKFEPRY